MELVSHLGRPARGYYSDEDSFQKTNLVHLKNIAENCVMTAFNLAHTFQF